MNLLRLSCSFAAAALVMLGAAASAQTTAFTYQGRLLDGGAPANGPYDLQFEVFTLVAGGVSAGPVVTLADVQVINGLFTVNLDFGATPFPGGANRYLQVRVRPGISVGAYTNLTPRQQITPTPFAIMAATADNLELPHVQTGNTGTTMFSLSNTGVGVVVTATHSSGNAGSLGRGSDGVFGQANTAGGNGVQGVANNGTSAYGVWGRSTTGLGVVGDGVLVGVRGSSDSATGSGIRGRNTSATGTNYGVFGEVTSPDGIAIYGDGPGGTFGYIGGNNNGAYGRGGTNGVVGESSFYDGNSDNGSGVLGRHLGSVGYGVKGTGYIGVIGYGSGNGGGVVGRGPEWGVRGTSDDGYGIYGTLGVFANSWAGWFQGRTNVAGTFSATTKLFMIDHPLDPANKYLIHSCVESDERMNIYKGNVVLDANGEAVVDLPSYFNALNTDFTYNLTCIGGHAPVYVAEEVADNRFKIAGGKPGMKVSWMVTGVRQDAYAKANPLQTEVEKPEHERGSYLHPELFNASPEQRVDLVNVEMKKASPSR